MFNFPRVRWTVPALVSLVASSALADPKPGPPGPEPAEGAARVLRLGDDPARLGLLEGELDVVGPAEVVLPHGVLTLTEGAQVRIRASLAGRAVVRVESAGVTYQGDGGGAGRQDRAGWLRLGPDGYFRVLGAAPPEPDLGAVDGMDELVPRLVSWSEKRSAKLRALRRKQAGLSSAQSSSELDRLRERSARLEARLEVTRGWSRAITERFQALGRSFGPEEQSGLQRLARLGSASSN